MPEQLSLATVATCAVLAAVVFGGAYALAHDGATPSAPPPASPTVIRLAHDSVGELHRVRPLPALIVPAPRPEPREPVEPEPVVEDAAPVEPDVPVATPEVPATPAPTPAPAPTPKPAPQQPAPRKPLTFDDSG